MLGGALIVVSLATALTGCSGQQSAEETRAKYAKGAKDPAGEDERASKRE
jgi:hypothetical protein